MSDISTASVSNQCSLERDELLATFPEALHGSILPGIRELESRVNQLESAIVDELHQTQGLEDGWFVRGCIKAFRVGELVSLKRELANFRKYIPSKRIPGRISREQIERAREYPIVDLAETELGGMKKCGSTYRSLCPYHNERTPSFYLYPAGNNFHCFGCSEHGDVIALTQKLHDLSFVEAVQRLAPTYGA